MIRTSTRLVLALALTLLAAPATFAQNDDDAVLRPAEPDFALVSLPTALRLPVFGSAFRFTHRFSVPLNKGSFSDMASKLFGVDQGAIIGLEYRIGIVKNGQIGVQHSNDNRTWDFFAQYGLVRQTTSMPIDITVAAAEELIREPKIGTGDYERKSAPSVGVILSTTVHDKLGLYVEPLFVHNVFNEFNTASTDKNAVLLGLGASVQIVPTLYLVGEFAPRVSGFKANKHHAGFAVEKRIGGHVFQLNVSNSFDTTPSQLAMGADPTNNWHLGFNITRKFY